MSFNKIAVFTILCCIFIPRHLKALTLNGQINASSVTVSGNVTVSSMTVDMLTITNLFNLNGKMTGTVAQMKFSSSTISSTVTNTTFTAVSSIVQSITLLNANNYVRISLTGNLAAVSGSTQAAYITIYRDATNLGDSSLGLSTVKANSLDTVTIPVGIQMADTPGDISIHTYQVFIRVAPGGNGVTFPSDGTGYLLLEEVVR